MEEKGKGNLTAVRQSAGSVEVGQVTCGMSWCLRRLHWRPSAVLWVAGSRGRLVCDAVVATLCERDRREGALGLGRRNNGRCARELGWSRAVTAQSTVR